MVNQLSSAHIAELSALYAECLLTGDQNYMVLTTHLYYGDRTVANTPVSLHPIVVLDLIYNKFATVDPKSKSSRTVSYYPSYLDWTRLHAGEGYCWPYGGQTTYRLPVKLYEYVRTL